MAFAHNARGEFALAKHVLQPLDIDGIAEHGLGLGIDFPTVLAYADAPYGLGEKEPARRLAGRVADYAVGSHAGNEKSWWVNANLACAEAQLGRDAADGGDAETASVRYAAALAALERVRTAQGLVWNPLILHSPCFEPLASEPGYRALVEHLERRQQELRERLPRTLRQHGVADVRP